jgi:hypothetical protein
MEGNSSIEVKLKKPKIASRIVAGSATIHAAIVRQHFYK